MVQKRSLQIYISVAVIIICSVLLYTSFEARFNKAPKEMQLTTFKNTKHFNISVFGEGLSERDVQWVMWLTERFYDRVYQWYGDHSEKEWLTVYIAKDFPEYPNTNGEMILIPTEKVQKREIKFILIKVAHLLTGAYKWPWHQAHIAAEGLSAYLAGKYLGNGFTYQKNLEGRANLAKLEKVKYFCWKMSSEQQEYVYDKAGAFVGYLINKNGIKKMKELYDEGGEAWEKVYGNNLADLEKEWLGRYTQ